MVREPKTGKQMTYGSSVRLAQIPDFPRGLAVHIMQLLHVDGVVGLIHHPSRLEVRSIFGVAFIIAIIVLVPIPKVLLSRKVTKVLFRY